MADERDAVIAELRRMNEQLGALVAQQQSVIAAQRQLISELEQRLGEQDAAHGARATTLEAEVKRLERELLGPKTEKLKVPPPESDLGTPAPNEEELARRGEEIARKRRERALARRALRTEEVTYSVSEEAKRCPKCNGTRFGALGFETSATYEYLPGRFVRRVHRREKVACSCGGCILVAPVGDRPIPRPIGEERGDAIGSFHRSPVRIWAIPLGLT